VRFAAVPRSNVMIEGVVMRNITIISSLTVTLAGCGIAAKIDAKNDYRTSVTAYMECLVRRKTAKVYVSLWRLTSDSTTRWIRRSRTETARRTSTFRIGDPGFLPVLAKAGSHIS
jgi:hypothetical protein